MMKKIVAPLSIIDAKISLPTSKSISNRLLIIQALCAEPFQINNLSLAADTVRLKHLIDHPLSIQDCGEGGTTFRFLLALRAVQNLNLELSGAPRMLERPIGPLVQALNSLGAEIRFTGKEGYPPVQILQGLRKGGNVSIPGNISSQFLSALMLIGPYLEGGLVLVPQQHLVSQPYLEMTINLMRYFGVRVEEKDGTYMVAEGNYSEKDITVAPDWSSASYWFGIAACLPGSRITLKNLALDQFQGDAILMKWMKDFGVKASVVGDDIQLFSEEIIVNNDLHFDCSGNPDLAQTLAVVAAIKGVTLKLTGLSTLRIKETDRIDALQIELLKSGVEVIVDGDSMIVQGRVLPEKVSASVFKTYNDHRMAMSLAILSCSGGTVSLDETDIVRKSYPDFFKDLITAGFQMEGL
ncbi:3-phosphoshikimate 1-carboxyvinyltransferase [soil metagenome]